MKTKAGIAIEKWVKANGFTITKTSPHYGNYLKVDKEYSIMIRWNLS